MPGGPISFRYAGRAFELYSLRGEDVAAGAVGWFVMPDSLPQREYVSKLLRRASELKD